MSLFRYLKEVKEVWLTTHRHADIDAYCSVYALHKILASKGIKTKIYFPEDINDDAKRLTSSLPLESNEKFEDSSITIILDTNNPSLLSNISITKAIIIDHHPLIENSIRGIEFIDTNASSTCEVICRLVRKSKIKIEHDIALALLLGIYADSQHLALANDKCIECVYYLTRFTSLDVVKNLLTNERNYMERIARLKAIKRAELYKVEDKNLIIAISMVGSYNASAAKALIDAGADLSIVGSNRDCYIFSMRASNRFHSLTNIHLGIDIASKISKNGGGHASAAAFTAEKDVSKDILSMLNNFKIEKIKD